MHSVTVCQSIHIKAAQLEQSSESRSSVRGMLHNTKNLSLYWHTHTHTVKHTRSSQHRHARMFFHSITDSPDTLPWSPTQSCTSLHHKVLCLQLKEVVYLHKQVSKTKTNGLHVSPHHTSHAV